MKKPIIAWSHSALEAYDMCPKKFYHNKIKKDVVEPFGKAQNAGLDGHDIFEKYMKGDLNRLPPEFLHHAPVLDKFKEVAAKGDMYTEQQLAINMDFLPTGWYDKDCYSRAVLDLLIIKGDVALVVDWKFGKVKPNQQQLNLFIAFCAIFFPEIQEYRAYYYWAKEKTFTKFVVQKAEVLALWNDVLPKVKRLEIAVKTTDFPAKPSGLCKKYCSVKSCVHYGVGSF
jgi:hypothetical protein